MDARAEGLILVTGAAGVIGSRLVPRLRGEGRRVLGADLPETDLLDPGLPSVPGVVTVVHLAAVMSDSRDVPGKAREIVGGNLGTLLGALRMAPQARRLVLASTMVVYGPPRTVPVTEDHPRRPANLYGTAKVAAEECARIWGEEPGRSACVLRIASVYGPDDPPGRAVPNFLAAARRGEPPLVRGEAIRDYIHVDDVVEALVRAIDCPVEGVFHAATGRGTGTRELARIVTEEAGLAGPPREEPGPSGPAFVLDPARAREVLGFAARIGLREGIRSLLAGETGR